MIPGDINVVSDWAARPNKNNLLGKMLAPARLASFDLACTPVATAGANEVAIFVTDQPVEAGDGGDILSRWAGITGIDDTNTDDGRLYVSIMADDGDGAAQARMYSDSAKTALVASADLLASTGSRAITEENGSGLGGYIYQSTTLTFGATKISNGGFETPGAGGADIWANWAETAGDGALADEIVIFQAGAHSAKITAGASSNTYVRQTTAAVTASTLYRLSWYDYAANSEALRFLVYDVSNAADIIALTTGSNVTAGWVQQMAYFTTPVGCISARIDFRSPATNGNIVYLDTVSVNECTNIPDTDITVDYALATIGHWERYDSLWAAVD